MGTLWEQGYRVFLEVGPTPTLLGMGRQCVTASEATFVPSLRKDREDWREMLGSAALLYTRGVDLEWARFDRGMHRRKLALPTYPFERQRYWAERAVSRRPVSRASGEVATHPLLGRRLRSPLITGVVFEAELGIASLPLLGEHRIHGTVVVPAATYVEMALAAAREAWGGDGWSVEDLAIEEALVLPEEGVRAVQVILTTGEGATRSFQIASSVEGTDGAEPTWARQATGRMEAALPEAERTSPDAEPLLDIKARCPQAVPASAYYAGLRERGFELGPGFQAINGLWRGDGESLAELQLSPEAANDASAYQVHPAIFDACCHALGAAFPATDSGEQAYMVLGLKRFLTFGPVGTYVWSHATLQPPAGEEGDQETMTGDVRLMDGTGRVVAVVEGLQFKRARAEALGRVARESLGDWLYDVAWQLKAGKGGASAGSSADYLLAPEEIGKQVGPEIAGLAEAHGLAQYEEWLPRVEALAGAYVQTAFRQLGWDFRLGQRVTVTSLASELRVTDRHRRLLGRMLGILEEDGIVRAVGGEWEVTRLPLPGDPQAQYAELLASSPMATIETSLTGRCGEQLAAVLRGDADPLPLLFPGGSPAAVERIYQDSPGARTFNGLMQKAIAAAIVEAPPGRILRVLEIGAGTGGTTASVLPVLPADRSLYMFTDVSPAFTARAADRFQAYPFVRYQLLDVEKDPKAQEIGSQQFDVIIAVNVLHATRKLRETLGHVRQLLAPEGLLAIMEAIRPMRWLDLTFGLTEGWWRFADEDLRPSHPLLSSRQWRDLLTESGFTGPVALPEETDGGGSPAVQALILARAPKVDVQTTPVAQAVPPVAGDWLIFADKAGVGTRLAERIRGEGGQCVVVLADEACSADGSGVWRVNPGRPEDFHRVLAEARPSGALPWRAIVHLWSMDASASESMTTAELEAAQVMGCGSLLHLVQAAIRGPASPIWAVTRGAQPVGPDPAAPAVAQSAMWGLGRVVSLEHPEFWGGLVDLDAGDADGAVPALLEEIESSDGEDQVARRGNARYVARLVRNRGLKTEPARLRPDAAYLITGGLGRIGLKVARWMAEQGARHLVLMGRHGLPDRSAWPALKSGSEAGLQVAAVTAVEALGATVEVVAADASDADQLSAVLARFGQEAPPLRGVIHAAAATGTVALRDMTLEALSSVLRPKVAGAWVLHRLTSAMELDFFVMFSSTTGLLGVRDLGHYAAANTFLDALAHYRHSACRPAVSINWGVWDVLGGASADPQKTFAGAGLRRMASPRALKALGHLMCSDAPQIVVAGVDWATLKPVYEAKRRRPFLEQVGAPTTGRPTASAAKGSDILQRLAAARPQDRWDLLVDHVRGEVARVLRLPPGRTIELHRGLFDLGMDSLMSVELKSRLEASLGRPLPSTLTFNYPNVGALSEYLAKEALSLELSPPPTPANASPELVAVAADTDDISEDELASQLAEKLAELR
jgi:SAM-dependent methyltransferase/acyl carrier protein